MSGKEGTGSGKDKEKVTTEEPGPSKSKGKVTAGQTSEKAPGAQGQGSSKGNDTGLVEPPVEEGEGEVEEEAPWLTAVSPDDQEYPKGETCKTFIFRGEGHSLGNALRYMITHYPEVKFCAYTLPHPSEEVMHLRIQTIDGVLPSDILARGLSDLHDLAEGIKDKFEAAMVGVVPEEVIEPELPIPKYGPVPPPDEDEEAFKAFGTTAPAPFFTYDPDKDPPPKPRGKPDSKEKDESESPKKTGAEKKKEKAAEKKKAAEEAAEMKKGAEEAAEEETAAKSKALEEAAAKSKALEEEERRAAALKELEALEKIRIKADSESEPEAAEEAEEMEEPESEPESEPELVDLTTSDDDSK